MPTLYSHKESNIRKTWLLITIFFVLVMLLGWFLSVFFGSPAILILAIVISISMSAGAYWWSDKLVLKMAHARPASKEEFSELHRIVENLSITAGLPMPKLYIIDEQAPNALATGRDAKHAVVAVTRGLLDRLDRTELEGVLAHELSHIGNRDMLISTIMVVLVGIIIWVTNLMFYSMLFGGIGGRRGGGGGGHGIMIVIGIAVIILAPLLAVALKLAVSRKREFLADASGALLTRYPEGLASALEKIAQDPHKLKSANNATAHLYFENPYRGDQKGVVKVSWLAKLFMTHPSVEDRVKALRGKQ